MTDFFDWLSAGDWGLAAERLREEFRLSHEEMRRTTEALAPAFLLGVQRAVADPTAWASFARAFPLQSPSAVAPGAEAGGAMMAGLFGNDGLANAVARHASLFSGVAPDTISRMMPSLAAMTVETMMRMSGWRREGPQAYPADVAGRTLAEMMRRSANAVEAFSRPSSEAAPAARPRAGEPGYLEFLFADALKGGFPWFGALRMGDGAANMPFQPFGSFNPFAAMPGSSSEPTAPKESAAEPRSEGNAPFADFMDAGRSFQEAYMRQMLSLFERHAPKGK